MEKPSEENVREPLTLAKNASDPGDNPQAEDVPQAPQTFAENKESTSDEEILTGKPSEENMREPLTLAKNATNPGDNHQAEGKLLPERVVDMAGNLTEQPTVEDVQPAPQTFAEKESDSDDFFYRVINLLKMLATRFENKVPCASFFADQEWKILWKDLVPEPNIMAYLELFNEHLFDDKLNSVTVYWSYRMTVNCAKFQYVPKQNYGLSSIVLSLPLLKSRSKKDVLETLLQEMIRAYLCIYGKNSQQNFTHGVDFMNYIQRTNKTALEAKTQVRHAAKKRSNEGEGPSSRPLKKAKRACLKNTRPESMDPSDQGDKGRAINTGSRSKPNEAKE